MSTTPIMSSCQLRCACGWSGAGTLYFRPEDQHKTNHVCPTCGATAEMTLKGNRAPAATFPFTSKHITGDGTEVTVNSLYHMRQLEREYGVVLTHTGEDSPKDLPAFRGGEYRDQR